MAVKRVDLSQERGAWRDAERGEEVREAGISSLQKTEDVINDTVDAVNQAAEQVEEASGNVNLANQKAEDAIAKANETVGHANQILESAQHQANAAAGSATLAESWSSGGTGTRTDENTNNSMYFSQQSRTEADRAKSEADRASQYSRIVAPGFYFDLLTSALYMKAGVGVDFVVSESRLYWKIS